MPRPTSNRVRKNYRLDPALIDRARQILGTKTETETIEQALDMVAFRKEVIDGVERGAGAGLWVDVFQDGTAGPEE